MDFSVTKEPVFVSEVIFDGQAEQGVEFDYVLPDYYPDIFKILRCSLRPGIVSYNISGDKLICDGIVYITVLYLSEGSDNINCVEHRYTYSKTVDLPKSADNGFVTIIPKTDYCTCRAVSGRRLDVRGAVSFKIKITALKETEIITDAKECGIEVQKKELAYGGRKITVQRQFTLHEEIEAAQINGRVKAVISCDTVSRLTECKIVADKTVLKGNAVVKAVYLVENEGKTQLQSMEAEIPLSQIVDLRGVTDKHTCYAQFKILSCELSAKHGDEDNGIFSCEMTVKSEVTANMEETVYPVTDMYSTVYESSFTSSRLTVWSSPSYINQQLSMKELIECEPESLQSVVDCSCELSNITCRVFSSEELIISGQASYNILALNSEGTAVCYDKTVAFELKASIGALNSNTVVEPFLQTEQISYSISGNNIEIRVGVLLQGLIYENKVIEVVKEISLDESALKAKNDEYSLKLYFADENEDVWSIAKRYNTSPSAILQENEADEANGVCGMLLIPMV